MGAGRPRLPVQGGQDMEVAVQEPLIQAEVRVWVPSGKDLQAWGEGTSETQAGGSVPTPY